MRRHQTLPNFEDEYARYCNSDITYDVEPLAWWMEKTQQTSYPNLSKMALDILSIPAMSAEPERVFSEAKQTITDNKNRLGIEIISAFECLKSWYKLKTWDGGSAVAEEIYGIYPKPGVSDVLEGFGQTAETAV